MDQEIGTYVSVSDGLSVYVNFRSSKVDGWYVDPNFCNNVMNDILDACSWRYRGDMGSTGGYWTYDNQGTGNLDTQ
jgi:hypothetical protein